MNRSTNLNLYLPESSDYIAVSQLDFNFETIDEAVADVHDAGFSLSGGTTIPDSSNLNAYVTPGNYCVVTNASAETMTNIPVALSGALYVKYAMLKANQYLQQVFAPYNNQFIYVRNTANTGSSWSSWKVLGTDEASWTISLPRDTISEAYDCYAVRTGNIVQCRGRFKITANSGGNSYIDGNCFPKFGMSTIHYTWGVWNSETTDYSGTLHGSNNSNVWFVKDGVHVAMGSQYQNNYIWVGLTYTLT